MKYTKGDFFIVVNKKDLSGKSSAFRSLFMALCSFANEDGICFPSRNTLAKESGTSLKTVDRLLKDMELCGVIKKTNRNNGQEFASNIYQIMIVSSEKMSLPSVTMTPPSVTRGALTIPNNYNYIKHKKANAFSPFGKKGSEESILFKEEQKKIYESKNRAYHIIGAYMSFREESLKGKIRTKGQLYEFCQRHIKAANKLKTWDDDQLDDAFTVAERDFKDIDWTLESIIKYLTK